MTSRRTILLNGILAVALGCLNAWALIQSWGWIAQSPTSLAPIDALAGTPWIRPYLFAQDLLICVVLCLPIAAVLCWLKPRRLMRYTRLAVLAGFIWSNAGLLEHPPSVQEVPLFVVGWAVELLMVPLAVLMLRQWVGTALR